MVQLTGSSWQHERGHAPMVATAAEYERITGGAVRGRLGTQVAEGLGVSRWKTSPAATTWS